MPRYIDADNLFSDVTSCFRWATGEARKAYRNALDKIIDAPTADVEEVRHGKWIDKGHFTLMCDKCKAYVAKGLLQTKEWMPRCPNCGARMDGKESGE